jgi:hypothetical protein
VRAPEPLAGLRVVAAPAALDALAWPSGVTALRFAPDDIFALGAAEAPLDVAIAEREAGYVGWWLSLEEFGHHVAEFIEWPLPSVRPALAQGLIAGVPAKVWLTADRALLLTAGAYAHELMDRLP